MTEVRATIKNRQGIHVRPSGVIINEIENIKSDIILEAKGISMPLMSIMDLLALGLQHDEEVLITVSGEDEKNASEKLKELFEREYDFPPR